MEINLKTAWHRTYVTVDMDCDVNVPKHCFLRVKINDLR
jgi:hypothetical protein